MFQSHLKIKAELVNRYGVFPGKVLHDTRQEGLCEEEAGHPEHAWLPIVVPTLQHQ